MKTKLLITLICLSSLISYGQITKAEAFTVGTKLAFYPNQCGNTIPEAADKLTFCDKIDNLGVVERSYGLSDRGVIRMLPNHFNEDEVYVTRHGLSIRNTDGTWENIPNIAIPTFNTQNEWTNAATIKNGLVLPDGKVIIQAFNTNYKFDIYDRTLKTLTPVSFPFNRSPLFFAYDDSRDLTWILAFAGGGTGGRYLFTYNGSDLTYIQELSNISLQISPSIDTGNMIYHNDNLYVGSLNGLFKIDLADLTTPNITTTQYNTSTTPSLPFDFVSDFEFDNDNNLWLTQRANGDGGIVKFDVVNETYELYQRESENNPSINRAFDALSIDGTGAIWATAVSYKSMYKLTFPADVETWDETTDAELTALGVPITYVTGEIYFRNDKLYFTTRDGSSGNNYNYEVVIKDGDTWYGRNDDEEGNLSYRMNRRFTNNMPDSNGGVWWFNAYDDIVVYRDADDNRQSILIDDLGFAATVDDENKAIVIGGNPIDLRKIDFPNANTIQQGVNQINDIKRVADQIWVFDRDNKKIDTFKDDALLNTYNLDEDWYENAFYFALDDNADAWFMRYVVGNLEIKKFNISTLTSTTYDLSTLGNLGDFRKIIAAPNGGVWFVGTLGAIYQEDGIFYDFMAADYTEINGLRDLVVDTNAKAYLLNGGTSITTLENPTDVNPILINTSLQNANSILPALDHNLANALTIDSEGSVWTNASQNTFKLIDVDFATEYITQPAVLSINDEELNSKLSIYPNPTDGIINIESTLQVEKIEVFSILGRKISTFKNTSTINLTSQAAGIYLLKITIEGQLVNKKIVLQ